MVVVEELLGIQEVHHLAVQEEDLMVKVRELEVLTKEVFQQ
jgi:hypothetical protein